MIPQKFSKKEAIRFGWETMKSNFGFLFLVVIVSLLLGIFQEVLRIPADLLKGSPLILLIVLIGVIFWGLQRIVEMGIIKIVLKFCDNEKPAFSELFSCFHLFFNYLGGMVLYLLIVVGGIILLIVPGIIWAIRFQFFGYLIVDKGLGPVASLKKSFEITKGSALNLFLFGFLAMGVMLLGVLCLLAGILVAIPIVAVAFGFVYRKLLPKAEVTVEKVIV